MTGRHAVGDYVVFAHGKEKLRGYVQQTTGGKGEPIAYVVRAGDRDYDVREGDIVDG